MADKSELKKQILFSELNDAELGSDRPEDRGRELCEREADLQGRRADQGHLPGQERKGRDLEEHAGRLEAAACHLDRKPDLRRTVGHRGQKDPWRGRNRHRSHGGLPASRPRISRRLRRTTRNDVQDHEDDRAHRQQERACHERKADEAADQLLNSERRSNGSNSLNCLN